MTDPVRPQLAASATIFRDGKLLLVRRAREPGRGRYSLPGGRVEWGETVEEAVHREVREETALEIDIVRFAGIREVLPRAGAGHFVVLSYAAIWRAGEVVLNDELDGSAWVTPDALGEYWVTDGLPAIVSAACAAMAKR